MLMSEYIFDFLPVDYFLNDPTQLKKSYDSKEYKIKLNEKYLKQ
jgi:hypothetical protein